MSWTDEPRGHDLDRQCTNSSDNSGALLEEIERLLRELSACNGTNTTGADQETPFRSSYSPQMSLNRTLWARQPTQSKNPQTPWLRRPLMSRKLPKGRIKAREQIARGIV